MVTHFSILVWRIPWTEKPGRLQSTGCKESDTTEQLHFHFHFSHPIGVRTIMNPASVMEKLEHRDVEEFIQRYTVNQGQVTS